MMTELTPSVRVKSFEWVGPALRWSLRIMACTSVLAVVATGVTGALLDMHGFKCRGATGRAAVHATPEAVSTAVVLQLQPAAPPPAAEVGTGRCGDPPRGPARARVAPPAVRIVDVSGQVSIHALIAQLQLGAGERITAINDKVVDDGDGQPPPDVLLSVLAPLSGGYLDVTVSGATTERRVLVLMH